MKKKLLALFLAFTMSVSMMPATAFAETADADSLQEMVTEMVEMTEEETSEESEGNPVEDEITEETLDEELPSEEDVIEETEEKISLKEETEGELELFADNKIWNGSVATSFAGGKGTKDNPYLIENGAQLALMNDYLDRHFRLTADIYLNDTEDWEDWTADDGPVNAWTPLGTNGYFSGVLDGNEYAIYGLYVDGTVEDAGLFKGTSGAAIKDLTIKESAVFCSDQAGAIAAYVISSTVENCTNEGKVSGADEKTSGVAGIAGSASRKSIIEDCTNKGNIFNYHRHTGGVTGQITEKTKVIGCVNYGTVTTKMGEGSESQQAAGITSGASDSEIIECVNYGKVDTDAYRVGGIVGQISGDCTVIASENHGEIIAENYTGGIVGRFFDGTVEFCENTGDITATVHGDAGGISGEITEGVIRNCVNIGDVTSSENQNVGGIVSILRETSDGVMNCYNMGDILGSHSVGGICGNTVEGSKVLNCWNGGTVEATSQYGTPGAITGRDQGCSIVHCYNLEGSCGETYKDQEKVTEITETELKSADFLKTLNDWVDENQRVDTEYAYWKADKDGYPTPMGDVPDYKPVTGVLTLHQPENGSAKISHTSALTETEIIVTVTADTGYIPYQVWFCGAEDPDTLVYAEKTGDKEFTFSMPYGDAEVYVSVLALPENGVWDGSVATTFAGGDGTVNNPYLIANASQLALIAEDNDASYRLITDIYLNDTTGWEYWTAENGPANTWTPPYRNNSYGGTFDGDGHTIYGLYTDATQSYQAFLYQIRDIGCVKNLEIDKSKIFGTTHVAAITARHFGTIESCVNKAVVTATGERCGGIAAVGNNISAIIENCTNYGEIVSSAREVGGILGNGSGVVKNCKNYGDVSSTLSDPDQYNPDVGGIVGAAYGEIWDCDNYGNITSSGKGGGIAGNAHGIVDGCTNYGDVTAVNPEQTEELGEDMGGIAGASYSDSIVRDCINNGAVSGTSKIGGICGYVNTGNVTGCTNNGTVAAEIDNAGGIVGYHQGRSIHAPSIVSLCVNTGAVSVGMTNDCRRAGGIIGISEAREGGSCEIRNCYNTGKITGMSGIGGLIGELRAKEADTYALIENCYSVGMVSGNSRVSGTVARLSSSEVSAVSTVRNCYCLNTVSADVSITDNTGTNNITNVVALSKSDMGKQSSFAGFDFTTVWYCADDGSYPVFLTGGEEGKLGNAATFVYYPEISVIVTAEKDMKAMLVSYENGKMKALDMVTLSSGEEGTLTLKNWGEDVKLFAVSENQTPLCEAEEL